MIFWRGCDSNHWSGPSKDSDWTVQSTKFSGAWDRSFTYQSQSIESIWGKTYTHAHNKKTQIQKLDSIRDTSDFDMIQP